MTRQTRAPLESPLTVADRIFGGPMFTRLRVSPTSLQTKAPLRPLNQTEFRRERIGIIYILVDPRDRQVRYVGYTSASLAERLRLHLQHAKKMRGKANYYTINWLNELIDEGLRPDIFAVDTYVADNWQERERHWMHVYRQLGCNLTNTKAGGGGGEKRKPSSLKGRRFSDEHRAAIAASARRRFEDPDERRKMSEIRKMQEPGPRGPYRSKVTHCPQGHEYTPENTYKNGGKRRCRTCSRMRDRLRPRRPSRTRLLNSSGTPQSDADMANAARIAQS